MTDRYTAAKAFRKYESATYRRYSAPASMIGPLPVNMRISHSGKNSAASVATSPMVIASLSVNPITRSMVSVSPLPQYCAHSTVAPEHRPKNTVPSTNCICPAKEAPEMAVWLTKLSIATSAELTAASIRC